eukprot:CAMPEP_0181297888 /NCGR_PEP_ID=MMETSP1101-20121128/5486_1 /TAXON_ID=46948 /ORGANISM="Rhodomonas abbreviata, Strain Caron Lab Isolate" /LENGTH=157 /DNA_ID=CAMNT_0023402867 /DNA_START=30 /DNA_END=503 /DNA_ORIENTATION=+
MPMNRQAVTANRVVAARRSGSGMDVKPVQSRSASFTRKGSVKKQGTIMGLLDSARAALSSRGGRPEGTENDVVQTDPLRDPESPVTKRLGSFKAAAMLAGSMSMQSKKKLESPQGSFKGLLGSSALLAQKLDKDQLADWERISNQYSDQPFHVVKQM